MMTGLVVPQGRRDLLMCMTTKGIVCVCDVYRILVPTDTTEKDGSVLNLKRPDSLPVP
jgi:hypothetical protein